MMNITNTTNVNENNEDESTTLLILAGCVVVMVCCYFCNRNEQQDRADMEARAARAQARIDIRNG
tara:strand:+ start:330 stop:524 length:195 start_codon:yes stop_codon:yes gene_type:complete